MDSNPESQGNASTGVDGVQMDGGQAGLKTLYENLPAVPDAEGLLDDQGGESFGATRLGKNSGRTPDGVDTDFNTSDFSIVDAHFRHKCITWRR